MKERIRKYIGWGLLGLSFITGLIIPVIIISGIASYVQRKIKEKNQTSTARSLVLKHSDTDPYLSMFDVNDTNKVNDQLLSEVNKFKELVKKDPEEPSFFRGFYNRVIGVVVVTPSQQFLSDAYHAHKKRIEKDSPEDKKSILLMMRDVYELLKDSFGRAEYEHSYRVLESEKALVNDLKEKSSASKISTNLGKSTKRKSSPMNLRKSATCKKQAIEIEKRIEAVSEIVGDKWKEEKGGKPVTEGKTLKI